MSETTFVKAINDTLAGMMREEERVIVLGEDVAEGGPYPATEGLAEEFGTTRVLNTPISEGAVCGVEIGAAQAGLRPVVEIMFIDFLTLALDQLVNRRSGGDRPACVSGDRPVLERSDARVCRAGQSGLRHGWPVSPVR